MTTGMMAIPGQAEPGPRDFFIYTAEFLSIGAGATATVRIPIQADSAFLIHQITGDVRELVATEAQVVAPAMRLQLLDSGTGRILMDMAQEWTNMVGTAQRPFFLPLPKELKPNSTLAVTLTNDAVAARFVRLAFIGFKSFPGPS